MSNKTQKIGWIGAGRMGTPMIERLLKAGHDVTIWNRTRAKAEPLAAKGGKLVDKPAELASCDVVFAIVSTGKDVEEVLFGKDGLLSGSAKPKMVVDCSSISVEESAAIRKRLKEKGVSFIAAPVSGNAKVIKAGKLSSVVSGPEADAKVAMPLIEVFAPQGVVLRRRRRARAHLQDRAQRHARRGDREPDRDHAARQQDGRAAPRLPRLHEQRRHGLDVHRATRRRRWSISTGPPPSRRSCCARTSISASSSAANGTCRCR